jgi:ubiquitin-like 1-activating enzyme E1 B
VQVGSLVFDKEDALLVEFVTSASNLRSDCYGIATQSLFDAKGMAGNIVHAVATTNAAISGLIVIEALKVLCGAAGAVRGTYVATEKRFVATARTEAPVAGCMACGQAQLTLRANTGTMTLGALLGEVVKKRLAVSVPMLQCGDFLYEEGEGLEDDEIEMYQALLKRPLAQLPGGGLGTGSIVAVKDETQCFNLELIIVHQEEFGEAVPEGFTLAGAIPVAKEAANGADGAANGEAAATGADAGADDSDDLEVLDSAPPPPSSAIDKAPAANGVDGKRKRGGGGGGGGEGVAEGEEGAAMGKKARAEAAGGADKPIEL